MSGRAAAIFSIACRPSPTLITWIGSPAKVSAITRWTVMLSSARRRVRMCRATRAYRPDAARPTASAVAGLRRDGSYSGPGVGRDEVDDVLHRRAGDEDALDAH